MTHIFNNFKITSTRKESKPAPWDKGTEYVHTHHWITITNTETHEHTGFDFWASNANPEIKTEYDIMNAFRAFVEDALSGTYTFPEFCNEFGYDEDNRAAEKTWKSCRRAYEKFDRLTNGADVYEFLDTLEEYA